MNTKLYSWKVTARCMNRWTGDAVLSAVRDGVGVLRSKVERTEVLGFDNAIFNHLPAAQQVHEAYEAFWNNLNPGSEEVVLVTAVELLKTKETT